MRREYEVTRVTGEEVADLYSGLLARGVQIWVDGGWGIDALVGRQTRPHKDLDAIVAFENLRDLTRFLSRRGFALEVIWPENRWAPCPEPPALIGRESPDVEVATAFVLKDVSGRELDFHIVRFDEHGNGLPAWNSDFVFPAEAFAGLGIVGGTSVRCLSAETQMATHTGYALQEGDVQDLRLLNDHYGIPYPDEVAAFIAARRRRPRRGATETGDGADRSARRDGARSSEPLASSARIVRSKRRQRPGWFPGWASTTEQASDPAGEAAGAHLRRLFVILQVVGVNGGAGLAEKRPGVFEAGGSRTRGERGLDYEVVVPADAVDAQSGKLPLVEAPV